MTTDRLAQAEAHLKDTYASLGENTLAALRLLIAEVKELREGMAALNQRTSGLTFIVGGPELTGTAVVPGDFHTGRVAHGGSARPIRPTVELEVRSDTFSHHNSVESAVRALGIEIVAVFRESTCEWPRVVVYEDTVPPVLPDWLKRRLNPTVHFHGQFPRSGGGGGGSGD